LKVHQAKTAPAESLNEVTKKDLLNQVEVKRLTAEKDLDYKMMLQFHDFQKEQIHED
jgi:hypothetical protein